MSRRAKYANAGFDERLERSAADAAGRRQNSESVLTEYHEMGLAMR
jgi:hypothetical protein